LNCKVPRTRVIVIHIVRSTIRHTGMLSGDVTRLVSLRNHSVYLEGYAVVCISGERQQNLYEAPARR